VPAILIEKVEELLKCLVWDVDLRVASLQFVDFKEAPVEVGNVTKESFQLAIEFSLIW
jgi:hypothetical protein